MTPPPAPPPPLDQIRLDEMGELIAGLPGLLGFPPTDSLVLATFSPGVVLGPTIRVDLPEPRHGPDLMRQLGLAMRQNEVVAAAVVVVGGGGADPPTLPHRDLVELLARTMAELDIRLVHSAWVPAVERDVTWWCYESEECTGQVRDPRISALAALRAVDGSVTFANRVEMESLLTPDQEDRVAHRAQLLAAARTHDPAALLGELLAAVESAADDPAVLPVLTDGRISRLAVALSQPRIRETCLLLAITDEADAAERLWTVLTRTVPAPERAEPAFLLALHAYLRGAAVYAGMALDVALDADPEHQLATLLRAALDAATPPHVVRRMVTESIRQAATRPPEAR